MTVTMYDTTDVNPCPIPRSAPAVAGYTSGWWPTYEPLVWQYPHAQHLSFAINARERARFLDVENGDATADQIPGWLDNYADRSHGLPGFYTSASNMQAGRAAAGPRSYLTISAHYTGGPHICSPSVCGYPQADGTQWIDHGPRGENYDISLLSDRFFTAPKPVDLYHYDRYPVGPFAVGGRLYYERRIVQLLDAELRKSRGGDRAKVALLRPQVRILRDRIWAVAHWEQPANWDVAYRGWRWNRLNQRLHGPVRPG